MHKVLEVVALPVMEEREIYPNIKVPVATGDSIRKNPGDTITKQEFADAGQTDEDIAALVKSGAIEEA